jgi:hypothetical protein
VPTPKDVTDTHSNVISLESGAYSDLPYQSQRRVDNELRTQKDNDPEVDSESEFTTNNLVNDALKVQIQKVLLTLDKACLQDSFSDMVEPAVWLNTMAEMYGESSFSNCTADLTAMVKESNRSGTAKAITELKFVLTKFNIINKDAA